MCFCDKFWQVEELYGIEYVQQGFDDYEWGVEMLLVCVMQKFGKMCFDVVVVEGVDYCYCGYFFNVLVGIDVC